MKSVYFGLAVALAAGLACAEWTWDAGTKKLTNDNYTLTLAAFTYEEEEGWKISGITVGTGGDIDLTGVRPDEKKILGVGYRTGYNAANNAKITSLVLPDVKYIDKGAFYSCKGLESVDLPSVVEIDGGTSGTWQDCAFRDCTAMKSFYAPNVETIGHGAFYNCSQLTSLSFPKARFLGVGASDTNCGMFQNCSALQTLELGSSVEKIGNVIFAGLPGTVQLVNTSFDSLVEAEAYAFQNAKCLVNFSAPVLERVGVRCFRDATNLESFSAPKLTYISQGAFYGCSKLSMFEAPELVEIADTTTSNFEDATLGYTAIKELSLPKLKKLGRRAFWMYGFKFPLERLSIPEVTYIGEEACRGIANLSELVWSPGKIETIGANAFYDCKKLPFDGLYMPELITLGAGAFGNCGMLSGAVVMPKITEVGAAAFLSNGSGGNLQITSFDGENVEVIGAGAFGGDTKLGFVNTPKLKILKGTYSASDGEYSRYTFRSCTSLTNMVPFAAGVEFVGYRAFEGCTKVKGPLVIDSAYTNRAILGRSFYNCQAVSNITICAESVTNIENSAFYGICNAAVIEISSPITVTGASAFRASGGLLYPWILVSKHLDNWKAMENFVAIDDPSLETYKVKKYNYPVNDAKMAKKLVGLVGGTAWVFDNGPDRGTILTLM